MTKFDSFCPKENKCNTYFQAVTFISGGFFHAHANAIVRETLDEYLVTLNQLSDKVERLDKRIEEFSRMDNYAEKVRKLVCFKGIKTHTAMSLIVETSDFRRFPSAPQYAAFLGLVPGEHSSSDSCHRLSITKVGNIHLRRLLTEAANSYSFALPDSTVVERYKAERI